MQLWFRELRGGSSLPEIHDCCCFVVRASARIISLFIGAEAYGISTFQAWWRGSRYRYTRWALDRAVAQMLQVNRGCAVVECTSISKACVIGLVLLRGTKNRNDGIEYSSRVWATMLVSFLRLALKGMPSVVRRIQCLRVWVMAECEKDRVLRFVCSQILSRRCPIHAYRNIQ